jgi:hypothetical protein
MINRSAVIVRPKKPFLDWVRAVDYDDAPEVTLDQMGETLYLVPDYEDPKTPRGSSRRSARKSSAGNSRGGTRT